MSKTGEALPAAGRCAACGADRLGPHLRTAGYAGKQGLIPTTDDFGTAFSDIVRCSQCGHMQLARFPPDAFLASAYGEAESSAYVEEETGQRATGRRVLDHIERRQEVGSLLDLGCWVGFLLAEARNRGWRTAGVEPSRFASAYARDVLDLPVQTADLFHADLGDRRFDAIALGDVIEHLIEPGRALDHINGLSSVEGVLHLTLPDAGSRLARVMGSRWWSVIPTHVQYFTRHSITVLLERHGWHVEEITTAPKAFSVGYYLRRLGGYSPGLSHVAVRLAAGARVVNRLCAPDFGDRMAVLARRTPDRP